LKKSYEAKKKLPLFNLNSGSFTGIKELIIATSYRFCL